MDELETPPSAQVPLPTVSHIVHYRLSKADVIKINARREDAVKNLPAAHADRPGWQAHIGADVKEGDVVPLVVHRSGFGIAPRPHDQSEPVQDRSFAGGQALLDGADSYWVIGAYLGTEPGEWDWPPKV